MDIPKTSPVSSSPKKNRSSTLQILFQLDSDTDTILQSRSSSDNLLSKIVNCTQLFTFTNPNESPTQQDRKRHSLLHVLCMLRTTRTLLDARVLTSLVLMVRANLFRPLPPSGYPCISFESFDDDAPPMVLSPSWPHLHIVYDILTFLVSNVDSKALHLHFDHSFILNLLTLFQSEDPRERDRLKIIYHQLYSKMTGERSFMRRSMSTALLQYLTAGPDHPCGIAELLEIWGSIINGFTIPLKEEHKVFLVRILMPLHKPKGMCVYHRQLSYCVTQFVMKDPGLSEVVVKGILRYWPVTNCPKEVLLIGEVEDLVEIMEGEEFEKVAVSLCNQIAKCLTSCSSQVAERALYVWNNEHFVQMASRCIEDILPSIVQAIERNIRWHWNKLVQNLTMSVKNMLEEMEPKLYAKCLQDLDLQESMAEQEKKKRKETWERLELIASNGSLVKPDNCTCVSR